MKFSIAPESTSATASALLAMEWTKNRSVIDFRADKYTSPLLPCLISADLIRQRENPHLFPSLWPGHFAPGPSCYSAAASSKLPCPWGWARFPSRLVRQIRGGLWPPVFASLGSF